MTLIDVVLFIKVAKTINWISTSKFKIEEKTL